jgi:molybdate transport repressor ModE-like protein
MTRITIRPAWTFVSETGEKVDPLLFELLAAIHDAGKLTLAAQHVKLSYRYAWELLERWERFFGAPLVRKQRGRGATLSVLGAKLLWAEQRSDASLFTQLENIASELNLEIGQALRETQTVLQLHASHGYAVEKLPALMHRHGHATIDLQYMGSSAALASLARSACDLAGFHVPEGDLAPVMWAQYARWLSARRHAIVRLVTRTQGIIVAKGNPLRIESIDDLVRPGVRFVNRQAGSGTRILFDALLAQRGIDARRIHGYDTGEFTHAAVAAFVASGMADAGFGVEPAARQFKLGFVPMIKERYMLACRQGSLRREPMRELIALLRGPEYRAMIEPVPGYALDDPGAVERVNAMMGDFDGSTSTPATQPRARARSNAK